MLSQLSHVMGIFEEIKALPPFEVEVGEHSILSFSFDPGESVFNQTLTKFELGPTQPKIVELLLLKTLVTF